DERVGVHDNPAELGLDQQTNEVLLPQAQGRTADVDAGLGRAGERDVLSKAELEAVLPVTRVRTDAGAGAGDLSRVVAARNSLAIDDRKAQKGVKTGVSKARGVLVNRAAAQ